VGPCGARPLVEAGPLSPAPAPAEQWGHRQAQDRSIHTALHWGHLWCPGGLRRAARTFADRRSRASAGRDRGPRWTRGGCRGMQLHRKAHGFMHTLLVWGPKFGLLILPGAARY
jgi:hypothetical protein